MEGDYGSASKERADGVLHEQGTGGLDTELGGTSGADSLRHPAPHSPQLLPASPEPAGGPAPGRAAEDGPDRSAVMPAPSGV